METHLPALARSNDEGLAWAKPLTPRRHDVYLEADGHQEPRGLPEGYHAEPAPVLDRNGEVQGVMLGAQAFGDREARNSIPREFTNLPSKTLAPTVARSTP